jgi:hypothetical protein
MKSRVIFILYYIISTIKLKKLIRNNDKINNQKTKNK